MNKFKLLALAILIGNKLYAQKFQLPNVVATYTHTISTSDQKTVFHLRNESELKRSEKGKLYFWYSANQIQSTQGGYSGRLLNGSYTEFYPNKNLKAMGIFKDGLRVGLWKNWDMNGMLKEIHNYRNGMLSGRFTKFSEGKIKEKGIYKKGQLHGLHQTFYSTDSVIINRYKAGKLKSYRSSWIKTMFNRFGSLIRQKK